MSTKIETLSVLVLGALALGVGLTGCAEPDPEPWSYQLVQRWDGTRWYDYPAKVYYAAAGYSPAHGRRSAGYEEGDAPREFGVLIEAIFDPESPNIPVGLEDWSADKFPLVRFFCFGFEGSEELGPITPTEWPFQYLAHPNPRKCVGIDLWKGCQIVAVDGQALPEPRSPAEGVSFPLTPGSVRSFTVYPSYGWLLDWGEYRLGTWNCRGGAPSLLVQNVSFLVVTGGPDAAYLASKTPQEWCRKLNHVHELTRLRRSWKQRYEKYTDAWLWSKMPGEVIEKRLLADSDRYEEENTW